ncbi:MAG TPA: PQQ-binding-like beta-propeller repeat protein, partial [Candidatus Paceibacterota bacterium]|nr:PQQ-binding-like beta-propeller repeat protein [Candidatus Paceibacterota bacterium]
MNAAIILTTRVRFLIIAAITLLLFGGVFPSHGAFISAPNRVDMVHDPVRNLLYISSGSSVLRYDLASQAFLTPVNLSGSLGGMDISPDGNTLAVADRTRTDTNVWIHLVDLNTQASQRAFFPRAFGEGGTYTVSWGADGAVLVSGTYEGSGWVPLRRYNPANGEIQEVASIRQSSMLSASGNRKIIGIEESNISSGPVHRYGVSGKAILNSSGTGWFNYEVGVNKDGTQVAAPTYGGTFIYNAQMQQITNLGVYAGQQPIGVAYHPTKDAVYFAWAGTSEVRVFNTYTFSQLGSFVTTSAFSAPGNAAFVHGRIKLSRDASLLFVTTSGGIDWFTNNISVPDYRWLAIVGAPESIGVPQPQGYGTNAVLLNTVVTNSVASVVEINGIRYYPSGPALIGATAIASTSNHVSFVASNDVRVTWNWQPVAYQLTASAAGSGSVSTTGGWFDVGAITTVSATPNAGARFVRWLGDLPESDATNNPVFLTMNQTRKVIATFAPTNGSATSIVGEWPTFGNGPAHTGYFPGLLGGAFFSNRWTASVGGSPRQVAVGGGRIYVVSSDSSFYVAALQESSGQNLWRYSFASGFSINPPTYDSGAVYVQRCNHSSDTHLWSFNASNGQVNWSSPTAAQWESYMAPTVADGKVWVNGGYYGGMYGFTQTNGTQLFFQSLDQYDDWTPAYYNGRLFSWVAGNFREHDPISGATLWSTNIGWNWSGYDMNRTIALDSDLAFFVGNPNLYAMSLSARQLAWQANGNFTGTPAVANGIVYAISNNAVAAFSISGQFLGTYNADTALQNQPIVTQDSLIVSSSAKTYVFDLFTRQLRQTIPAGGRISLANGVLYIATDSGQLIAMSSGNDIQLVINGSPGRYGNPSPNFYGTNWFGGPITLTNQVSLVIETNLTRYQCTGWTGTGNVPASGTTNSVAFTLTTNSSLTWQWAATDCQLTCLIAGHGTVSITNAWYPVGTQVALTATPDSGFRFVKWLGDVPASAATNNSVSLSMTQGRRVIAVFGSANQGPLAGDWPTFGNGPAHAGYFPGIVGDASFTLRWQAAIGGNLQQVAVAANRIFVTPYQYFGSAFLMSLHEYSGRVAWQYNFDSCYSINPPTYDSGCVYVQRGNHGGDTHLWNFNATTGTTNWRAPHAAQWERYMAPTVAAGGVWVNGGYYGGMYGFNQSDGSQRFFQSLAQVDGWTPAYYEGTVYSQVGTFRAHDPVSGATLWSVDTAGSSGGGATKTLSIADGRAYFIGSPNLFAIDLTNHTLALRIDGNFTGYPAIANGFIYAISNNTVAAFSTTGQPVGSYVAGTALSYQPIVTDDALIVASSSATYVFDLFTFGLKQTIPVGGYVSLANGVIYIATSGGDLYAYTMGNDVTLSVASNGALLGAPTPFVYGTNWISQGSSISPSVASPVSGPNGTRYVVTGWTGTGSTPPAGNTNFLTFTITNQSTLTWQWKTQYFLATAVSGNGSVNVAPSWRDAGALVNLMAAPSNYYHFVRWQDGVSGTGASVSVTMNGPLLTTAVFEPDFATNNTPLWWLAQYGIPATDAGALLDSDSDGLVNWREFQFGTNPIVPDTDGDGY